jgi:hypothetical protein
MRHIRSGVCIRAPRGLNNVALVKAPLQTTYLATVGETIEPKRVRRKRKRERAALALLKRINLQKDEHLLFESMCLRYGVPYGSVKHL